MVDDAADIMLGMFGPIIPCMRFVNVAEEACDGQRAKADEHSCNARMSGWMRWMMFEKADTAFSDPPAMSQTFIVAMRTSTAFAVSAPANRQIATQRPRNRRLKSLRHRRRRKRKPPRRRSRRRKRKRNNQRIQTERETRLYFLLFFGEGYGKITLYEFMKSIL